IAFGRCIKSLCERSATFTRFKTLSILRKAAISCRMFWHRYTYAATVYYFFIIMITPEILKSNT
ncbi:MAG: hypothetical protein RR675_05955, partial [Oscillospiraceae bacterium]